MHTESEGEHECSLKKTMSMPQRKKLKEGLERGSKNVKRSTSLTSPMMLAHEWSGKMDNDVDLGLTLADDVLSPAGQIQCEKISVKLKSSMKCLQINRDQTAECAEDQEKGVLGLDVNSSEGVNCPAEVIIILKDSVTSRNVSRLPDNDGNSEKSGENVDAKHTDKNINDINNINDGVEDIEPSEENNDVKDIGTIKRNVINTDLLPDLLDLQHDAYSLDSGGSGRSCEICYYQENSSVLRGACCNTCYTYICKDCMHEHIKVKVTEGFTLVRCPADSCTKVLKEEDIENHCEEYIDLYRKIKVDAENNPRWKTCPGCNKIHHFPGPVSVPDKDRCSHCGITWCVKCHAPWHVGMTCAKYQKDIVGKGQKALKIWAKCKGKRDANARKCPNCHFFIERISGCDHMCCTKCGTDFCYQCGKKHRRAWLLGDHYSRYRFFGCKYNLAENKPALRIAARSGVLIASVLSLPIAAGVVVSAGCVLIAVSPILVPAILIKKSLLKKN